MITLNHTREQAIAWRYASWSTRMRIALTAATAEGRSRCYRGHLRDTAAVVLDGIPNERPR